MKVGTLMLDYQKFKVVKIIDDYSLVINAGINEDLSINEKIEIFVEGEELFDIDTEKSLGTLDFIKDTLIITEIYPLFSVCQKPDIKKIVSSPSSPAVGSTSATVLNAFKKMYIPNVDKETITEKVKLNVLESDKSGRVIDNSPIKIGDLARVPLV